LEKNVINIGGLEKTATWQEMAPRASGSVLAKTYRLSQIMRITMGYVRRINRLESRGQLTAETRNQIMMTWAGQMMQCLRAEPECKGTPVPNEPVILVGNHISYVDIPLLMTFAPVVFIAKRQLQSWPVFGKAASCVGTIYVDRDSKGSRQNAASALLPALRDHRRSITVFPSGTTTMDESKAWRWGVFKLAAENGIPIQPFRIRYFPLRRAAYLLEDVFMSHLWTLVDGQSLKVQVEFHEPVRVTDPERDAEKWRAWSREGL
jgi:1-acyl-sn-glycerol-3-phosphate acyltransferase